MMPWRFRETWLLPCCCELATGATLAPQIGTGCDSWEALCPIVDREWETEWAAWLDLL